MTWYVCVTCLCYLTCLRDLFMYLYINLFGHYYPVYFRSFCTCKCGGVLVHSILLLTPGRYQRLCGISRKHNQGPISGQIILKINPDTLSSIFWSIPYLKASEILLFTFSPLIIVTWKIDHTNLFSKVMPNSK